MKYSLLIITTLILSASAHAGTKTLVQTGYWTGNDMHSRSPQPSCACDKDHNVRDCEPVQDTTEEVGYICYDEFIPDDSQGWVHAEIYTVKEY